MFPSGSGQTMSADAVLPGGPAPALGGAIAFCDASALGDAASVLDGTVPVLGGTTPVLGGTAPVLGGTGPVLGGTGWSTVAMARGPALRPMQCSVIELLFNLWLAYGKLVTSYRCCSLLSATAIRGCPARRGTTFCQLCMLT